MNFFDPRLTNDGQPYGPYRYKQIVKELYAIAKNSNTPYTSLLNITPTERDYIIECMMYEKDQAEKAMAEIRNKTSKD